MTSRRELGLVTVAFYVGAIIAANALTARFGLVPVGFTLNAPAGVFCAGLAVMLRNLVQDALGRRAVVLAILAGAAASSAVAPSSLALASGAAFGISELADTLVYTPLRSRGWARAVLPASALGALADTFVFLALARFPLTGSTVAGQFVGKTWAVWLPVACVLTFRSLRRRHAV